MELLWFVDRVPLPIAAEQAGAGTYRLGRWCQTARDWQRSRVPTLIGWRWLAGTVPSYRKDSFSCHPDFPCRLAFALAAQREASSRSAPRRQGKRIQSSHAWNPPVADPSCVNEARWARFRRDAAASFAVNRKPSRPREIRFHAPASNHTEIVGRGPDPSARRAVN